VPRVKATMMTISIATTTVQVSDDVSTNIYKKR